MAGARADPTLARLEYCDEAVRDPSQAPPVDVHQPPAFLHKLLQLAGVRLHFEELPAQVGSLGSLPFFSPPHFSPVRLPHWAPSLLSMSDFIFSFPSLLYPFASRKIPRNPPCRSAAAQGIWN